jgi:uncharacterized protein YndB with AHSA1/START domain
MPDLKLSRTFEAPLHIVWEAWTNPLHAKAWFGPRGFTCPVFESDLRPGGEAYYEMEAPDGQRFPNKGVYEDVVVPRLIVERGSVELEPGKTAFESRTRIGFHEHDGTTTMDVEQTYSNVAPGAEGAIAGAPEGWSQMLDKFAEYLSARFR